MASPLVESAVEAIELDAFSKRIPDLVPHDETLYGYLKSNATTIPISNVTAAGGVTRPSFRVPFRAQAGAAISQGTGNADSLGRGTGSKWAAFALSPVFYYSTCEISFLARISTEGAKRGLFNVQAQELKNTFTQATGGLEALLQGDGTGTLDQIPSTATITGTTGNVCTIVGLNNAFRFQDQQTVQYFSAVGSSPTLIGSFTVAYVDPVTQTITTDAAGWSAAAPVAGNYLVVNGSSAGVGASILGLDAWLVNSPTGSIGGLLRQNFGGRLSTPEIDLRGASITLSTGLRALTLLLRALGPQNQAAKNSVWYCGPDQAMQMAELYLNSIYSETSRNAGDVTPDVAKREWPKQYAGRPVLVGMNATPGELKLFTADVAYLGELLPLELYDFGGGITSAAVPDIVNGGYLTSTMFAYVTALNLAFSNVRAAVRVDNAAQPTI
jgi:hypothetical protein